MSSGVNERGKSGRIGPWRGRLETHSLPRKGKKNESDSTGKKTRDDGGRSGGVAYCSKE